MLKVLVIAYYFPPKSLSGVQRVLKFVKYLPKNNWKPTVLTSTDGAYYAYDDSLLEDINDKNIEVIKVEGKEIHSKLGNKKTIPIPSEIVRKIFQYVSSFLYVPDNKKAWAEEVYKKGKEILSAEEFDCIFVSGPPFSSFITACKLKREFGIPLVLDYRDLWYGNHFAVYPTPFHRLLHSRLEYSCMKEADRVIVINRRIKEKLLQLYKFRSFKDVTIISQGFDPEDFEKFRSSENSHNPKFRITYTGIFYEQITPKYFLQAVKRITVERPDISGNLELIFIGYLREENRKLIRRLKLEHIVREGGYLPHNEVINRITSSDLLWVMVDGKRNVDTISSSKVFEYIGSGKPVLACTLEGALSSTCEEYGAAYLSKPKDIDGIKNAIVKAYTDRLNDQIPKPSEEFMYKLRRDYLAELLAKEFQSVLKEKV